MKTGGTYIDEDGIAGVTSIAPLQMFVVRGYPTAEGATITIPKSERVMGTTRFLRSGPTGNSRRDDFIIEFRDLTTKTTDRLSFVLRTASEIANDKNYTDVERLVSTSSNSNNGASRSIKAASSDIEQSLASQIYTKDVSGKALSVQFLPIESTSQIQIYYTPSAIPQPLQILGLRINTKDKVERLWLEDRLTNTSIEITPTMKYETYSNPTDMNDRFVIHLKETSSIDENENNTPIYAYAENNKIIVGGFSETDRGNRVRLIDINGRELGKQKVDDYSLEFDNLNNSNLYIVQMDGSRNQAIKVLVK